jgi:hypothetical protein
LAAETVTVVKVLKNETVDTFFVEKIHTDPSHAQVKLTWRGASTPVAQKPAEVQEVKIPLREVIALDPGDSLEFSFQADPSRFFLATFKIQGATAGTLAFPCGELFLGYGPSKSGETFDDLLAVLKGDRAQGTWSSRKPAGHGDPDCTLVHAKGPDCCLCM